MGMQPIMAVWSGYALGGTNLAENQLAPYIEQAKEQVRYFAHPESRQTVDILHYRLNSS